MELNNLKPTTGSRQKIKRVGRGDKTARRGENGQKSRAGFSNKIGFEGGQNPLYRRIPKRGFTRDSKKKFRIINIEEINNFNQKEVTLEFFKEKKILKSRSEKIKILGSGKLPQNIKISAHAFSKNALKAIEDSKGKAIFIK